MQYIHITATMNEIFLTFLLKLIATQMQLRLTFCCPSNLLECMYEVLHYLLHISFQQRCFEFSPFSLKDNTKLKFKVSNEVCGTLYHL